jgi:hypothetical protein
MEEGDGLTKGALPAAGREDYITTLYPSSFVRRIHSAVRAQPFIVHMYNRLAMPPLNPFQSPCGDLYKLMEDDARFDCA